MARIEKKRKRAAAAAGGGGTEKYQIQSTEHGVLLAWRLTERMTGEQKRAFVGPAKEARLELIALCQSLLPTVVPSLSPSSLSRSN